MDNLTEIFCLIDDFCKNYEPRMNARLLAEEKKHPVRPTALSLSELITLMILFHLLRVRHFKSFYLDYRIRRS